MEFLYPEFTTATHRIKDNIGISLEYPDSQFYRFRKDLDLKSDLSNGEGSGSQICIIRENIGYKCEWSYVTLIGNTDKLQNIQQQKFYILTSNLINLGNKQTYEPVCDILNSIDTKSQEINPYFKEIFIPYIDRKNGFYSVRIRVDYEKILDMRLFKKVLDEVYFEGINVLLSSRGLLSDNQTIINLKNKYYTFAYIHKDFDLTVRRLCEPLTFTVSIPLNFFNNINQTTNIAKDIKPSKIISFTNLDFVDQLDNIIDLVSNRSDELDKALYPNKILQNFVIDFELNSLRRFASSVDELMKIANYPIVRDGSLIQYKINLDNDLNLLSINIIKDNNIYILPQQITSQARLRSDFNNKRIFNYFLNIDNMYNDINTTDVFTYYKKYIKYPDVTLVDESITIQGIDITPEQIKQFRLNFQKNSESCYRFADAQKLVDSALETVQLADPIYHLFIPNDPKNDISISSISQQLKNNFDEIQKQKQNTDINLDTAGTVKFIAQGAVDTLNKIGGQITTTFKQDFMGDVNALAYILKRINIQEVLFTQVLCLLKGTNPNAQEIAALVSQLPASILNYLAYIQTIQELKGAAYLRALEQGISLDIELFCNDELAYFLKGLTSFLGSLNAGINGTLTFLKELDATLTSGYKAKNPYEAIIESVSRTIYSTVFDFTFDILNDVLTATCDDPLYDRSSDNFSDPFNTHVPISAGAASVDNINNNIQKIKANRVKALQQTMPEMIRELQFGIDLEYTVDLIGTLINDIKCILTPSESINLLKGNPTDEIIIIIKNIIRNKYSKDPNNLSYLLNEDKLKLFFKQLGLTVDQTILQNTVEIVNKIIPANVCTPEQYQIRCELFNGKLPPELGTLQEDTRNRVEKARKVLDKIKNGDKIYTVSALCPDTENKAINDLKTGIIKRYTDSIKSIFSGVLNTFNQEASVLNQKVSEPKELYRSEENDVLKKTFDKYQYYTYYSNLSKNMYKLDIFSATSPYKENKQYIIKYSNKNESLKDIDVIKDMLLSPDLKNAITTKECEKVQAIIDDKTINFLKEGRVLWENRPWNRNFGGIEKKFTERNGNKTDFYNELISQNKNLFEYIKKKKYVLFISSENDYGIPQYTPTPDDTYGKEIQEKGLYFDLLQGEYQEKIYYRFVYYDESINDFALVLGGQYLADEKTYTDDQSKAVYRNLRINLANYTGEIVSNLQFNKRTDKKISISNEEFFKKYYTSTPFFRIEDIDDNLRYGTYVVNENIINIRNIPPIFQGKKFELRAGVYVPIGYYDQESTLGFLQQIIDEFAQEKVPQIKILEDTLNTIKKFEKGGLFNITTNYDDIKNQYTRKINVAKNSTSSKDIEYKLYYNILQNDIKIPHEILNSVIFETFYKSLYRLSDQVLSLTYFYKGPEEENLFLDNVLFLNNEGKKQEYDKNNFKDKLKDRNLKIIKDTSKEDKQATNSTNLTKLNLSSDIRYKNCNVFPHYLNLDYLLKSASDTAKQNLCDTNLEETPDLTLKEILINLTVRTFITDIAVKIVPFLSLLDKNELYSIHKDKFVIDVFKEHLKQEMSFYTPQYSMDSKNNYYNAFVYLVNDLYSKPEYYKKIKQSDLLSFSDENSKFIEYFISREIKRFIKFAIDKKLLEYKEVSLYKQDKFKSRMISNSYDIASNTIADKVGLLIDSLTQEQIKAEFYTIMIYCLMSFTVDFTKRSIFNGSKSELVKIFFANVNKVQQQGEEEIYQTRTQEDVIKFINDLIYTPNPALMVYLYPDYSKYISFFLDSVRVQTKSILLNNAITTEPNIALTRATNYGLATAGSMAWSFMSQEDRNRAMTEAAANNQGLALLYDRLNKGMGPIPQIAISSGFALAGVPPGPYGIAYLALDLWDESIWLYKSLQEIEELKKWALNGKDPCKTTSADVKDISCKDNKEDLIKEVNQYEE